MLSETDTRVKLSTTKLPTLLFHNLYFFAPLLCAVNRYLRIFDRHFLIFKI